MRKLFFILVLLTLSAESVAADQVPPPKAPSFQELATNTARSTLLFIGGLLVVFGAVKKFQKSQDGTPDLITIRSRKALGPKASLLIAEVEGKRFLLSQTSESVQFLTEIESELAVTEPFEGYLERSTGNA